MKHLIVIATVLLAQTAGAECVSYEVASASLKETILQSTDDRHYLIFDLETTDSALNSFAESLVFDAQNRIYSAREEYSYRWENSPRHRGTIYGEVQCDGTAIVRISEAHD